MTINFEQVESCVKRYGWEVLARFPIYREGWETDNAGVVAKEPDGTLHIITTSHGGIRVDEDTVAELLEYKQQAADWLKKVDEALRILGVTK